MLLPYSLQQASGGAHFQCFPFGLFRFTQSEGEPKMIRKNVTIPIPPFAHYNFLRCPGDIITSQTDAPAGRQPPGYHLPAAHHGQCAGAAASCCPGMPGPDQYAGATHRSHDTSPGVAHPWLARPAAGNILSREKSKILTNRCSS